MTSFTNLHPSTRRAMIRRLDKAADLIEQGWTRGTFARDADGNSVLPESRDAVCWCLVGAVRRARADLSPAVSVALWNGVWGVSEDLYGHPPGHVNDKIARDRRTPLRILRETKKRLEKTA